MRRRWHDDAECRDQDPELWFPSGHNLKAQAFCKRCPVRRQCLEDAMREERGQPASMRTGVRGGLGPTIRAELDRQIRKAEET